jgi:uncharacterized protein
MKIEYDPIKRAVTLETRGLDMADAYLIFEADNVTFEDVRFEYSEKRIVTFGYLADRMIVLVWTERGSACRIISMRKANDREQALYAKRLGRPR